MITHVVLLQPKTQTTSDEIAEALEHVQALQQAIPSIESVQVGENLNRSNNRAYTHGFVMRFTNAEVFKEYAPHPAHQPVSQELQRLCESIIDFDVA